MRAPSPADPTPGPSPSRTVGHVPVRFVALVRRHPATVDVAIAVALFALAVWGVRYVQLVVEEWAAEVASAREVLRQTAAAGGEYAAEARRLLEQGDQPPVRLGLPALYALAAAATLPLAARRRFPATVAVLVTTALGAVVWFSPIDTSVASIAAWLALYSMRCYARPGRRPTIVAAAVTAGLLVMASGMFGSYDGNAAPSARDVTFNLALAVTLFGSAVAFGELSRRHRSALATVQAHASLLARQRADLTRAAVLDERVRIAREVHDVVAHHVSVMGMQAGASRLALGPTDPRVAAALASIEETGRQAIGDLQRLVSLLREPGESGPGATDDGPAIGSQAGVASPQPDLTMLDALVDRSRSAGMGVDVDVVGDLAAVPDGPSLSAYRIIQEALTNARRHGRGDHAGVAVRVTPEALLVTVRNPPGPIGRRRPIGGVGGLAPGHGLLGMRERAALHGGTLSDGVGEDGWFTVRARLPLRASIRQAAVGSGPSATPAAASGDPGSVR